MKRKRLWSLVLATLLAVAFMLGPVQAADEFTVDPETGVIYGLGLISISSSYTHTLALDVNNTVWGWGGNDNWQLGVTSPTTATQLVKISGLEDVVQIYAGNGYSTVLRADGTVWSWGVNTQGQLGNGNYVNQAKPVQAKNLTNVTQVSTGAGHVAALRDNGTVWTWGSNSNGCLGTGTTSSRVSTPAQVTNLTGVISVSAGLYTTVALKDNGTVWTWGTNYFGCLGNGSNSGESRTPVQVPDLHDVRLIGASSYTNFALKSDGTVWQWGEYPMGTPVTRPRQIDGLHDIINIIPGDRCLFALDTHGQYWFWGYNADNYSSFGDGFIGSYVNTPTALETAYRFITPSSSVSSTFYGIDDENAIWGWGANKNRKLTPYIPSVSQTPVLVFGPDTWYGEGIDPPDPSEKHTVTLTEHWADDSQPDVVTPHQVDDGDPLTINFTVPAGYTASAEVDADVVVDYGAGTLTIPSVTEERALKLTYTPEAEVEGHTVTIVEHYLDGALPDRAHSYTVPHGGTLVADYEVLDNYGVYSSIMRAAPSYFVDEIEQTVTVRNVDRDLTLTLEFYKNAYTITVTERYEDGALEDNVTVYTVRRGENFLANYSILDGYRVVDVESEPLGFRVGYVDQTISYERVDQDMYITLTYGA